MFRFIFLSFLVYIIFKVLNYFWRMIVVSTQTKGNNADYKTPKESTNNKYNIQQKDIVDANFEEIKENKEKPN
ncbi:MAG: hypothetical protein NTX22_14290 [Ignavibacteriales bacterium]|nr:hypothetical protein [Ignavibacteriales bacterium]